VKSGTTARRSVRESLAQLEPIARELDPDPASLAELWAAVGVHVLESASTFGEAPAYTAPSGAGPPALSLTEAGAAIAEALTTVEQVRGTGINQTSGGHLAYIPGGGVFPAALGDLMADVGNPCVGITSPRRPRPSSSGR
jgi:hypothetical protein